MLHLQFLPEETPLVDVWDCAAGLFTPIFRVVLGADVTIFDGVTGHVIFGHAIGLGVVVIGHWTFGHVGHAEHGVDVGGDVTRGHVTFGHVFRVGHVTFEHGVHGPVEDVIYCKLNMQL